MNHQTAADKLTKLTICPFVKRYFLNCASNVLILMVSQQNRYGKCLKISITSCYFILWYNSKRLSVSDMLFSRSTLTNFGHSKISLTLSKWDTPCFSRVENTFSNWSYVLLKIKGYFTTSVLTSSMSKPYFFTKNSLRIFMPVFWDSCHSRNEGLWRTTKRISSLMKPNSFFSWDSRFVISSIERSISFCGTSIGLKPGYLSANCLIFNFLVFGSCDPYSWEVYVVVSTGIVTLAENYLNYV